MAEVASVSRGISEALDRRSFGPVDIVIAYGLRRRLPIYPGKRYVTGPADGGANTQHRSSHP